MEFKSGKSYHVYHIPSEENWHVIGVDPKNNRLCAAGWPPSIGKISDCQEFQEFEDLTEEELKHRQQAFGSDWL